jgi:heme/copper-type cytochrome/quinol oxidase subunit 2
LASGLLNTSRTVGASIGLAALATLAATHTAGVLHGVVSTPARTAAALTDGYALAFTVATVVLLVTAGVAIVVLPSLRQTAQPAARPQVETPVLELDEALEPG